MVLRPEIKEFAKKTFLLTVVFSLFVNLLLFYFGIGNNSADQTSHIASAAAANLSENDTSFQKSGVPYLANVGVAVTMNIGTQKVARSNTPVRLYDEVMPINDILADQSTGRNRVISSEMASLQSYLNVLKTNVRSLLDSATDRETMFDNYVDQLKALYTSSTDHASKLAAQAVVLQSTLTTVTAAEDTSKQTLTTAYRNLDYEATESGVDQYLEAKRQEAYAHTYLIFLNQFVTSYNTLNDYNKRLITTLITNREALIKNVTVVLPDSSNADIMSSLNLVETPTQYNANPK